MSEFTTTPKLGLYKPKYNQDAEHWGDHLNANADTLDLTISGLSTDIGGPFLPIAGGNMGGPLNYYATGATALRSAQDRATDVANVLDFGADPTGVGDSTVSIQAAVATGRRVRIPYGRYTVTDAITISTGQIIEGDGPRGTLIQIGAGFNMSAAGVFVLAASTKEQDVEIRDLWIRFSQPNFSGMTRADIVHYPPGINSVSGNRAKFVNLQITNAWIGIDYDGGGAGFLDRVEMSAYSIGLRFAETTPVLDGTHISNFHWWNFDMTTFQANVVWDGVSIAADIGRIDGLVASDWIVFRGNINIKATAGTPGFYYMTNIVMDSISSTLTISNTYVCEIVNFHSTKGGVESPGILVTGGRVSFTNTAIQSSMVSTAAIQVTGGSAIFNGGTPWWAESAGAEFVSVTGGFCTLNNVTFGTHVAAHTAPFVHQSGTGVLLANNLQFPPSGVSGVAIQMDTAVAGNWIGPANYYGQLTNAGAGFGTAIGTQVTVTSTGGLITSGTNAASASTYRLNSVVGSDHGIQVYSGGSLRWVMLLGTGAEAGGNAGADFVLNRYSDTGVFLDAPLTVTRSNGYTFARNFRASNFGLNIATPVARQAVTGSRGGNVALASLLTALAAFGLITDSTTA